MGSTRLTISLCIVLLLGGVTVVPVAVTAQQDRVTITATIVDQDGRAVGSGVGVTATWDGGSVSETTASSGQVLLDVPEGANVSIQVDDDRYIRNIPYTVEDASTESVEVPVAQSATAEITVRNTDNATVEGARVFLYRGSEIVTNQRTGADGTVATGAIEAGAYQLGIQKAGYYTTRSRVAIAGQASLNRTIEEGEVLLTVSVADDTLEPPADLNASVRIPAVGTLQTGADGQTGTQVAVNTNYDLVVTADGYQEATRTVRVGESDTTVNVSTARVDEINVDAQNQSIIDQPVRMDITDEYGEPVTGATVTSGGEQVGTTDDAGVVRVTPESTGRVTYTIDDGDTTETVTIEVFAPNELQGTATPAASPTPSATASPAAAETTAGDGPGFTPLTVVAAVAALSLVAYRRR
ncbi:PGF-CTERM sorting domain-containing protein [Haloarcula sp. S1CR25-12]|uniref:PGF-CTERM sorting domain-containing protein n=1 Tax=Haloarcula saliterrae TaxID=2950534 RepID=A0ABU2FES3_9EURY|nr:PGF-CTERM sorting domain-containing protein [Haloarcula sp. S1CR25-12]MDS0260739.1 PGF-CTERM sorting domain-containing protein [Haloarcula sp. S1CR25-12]